MIKHRVYRDFKALVVAPSFYLTKIQDQLEEIGFGRVQVTEDDKQAPKIIKGTVPDLVVASKSLKVFSGLQLLAASRSEETTSLVPFIILGVKDDLKDSSLLKRLHAQDPAELLIEPIITKQMAEAVDKLLASTIDQDKEAAYEFTDRAEELVNAGEFEQAAQAYQQAVEIYDNLPSAWLELAKCRARIGQVAQAEASYYKTLEIDNFAIQAYFGLAELYEGSEQNEKAVDILHEALDLANMMKASGRGRARINYYIGEFQLRLKRLTEADEAFAEAIENDPDNAELRTQIGDSYAEHGHWEKSEEHYQAALDMDPDLAHVFNRLAMAYRRQGKFGEAMDLYRKAQLRHPEDENLLFNMARTCYEAGQPDEAKELLAEALEIHPEFTMARRFLDLIEQRESSIELDDGQ